MYLIISYDAEINQCPKLLKLLRKYLFHTHKSVFEGELTDLEKKKLEFEISKIIKNTSSSIIIYELPSSKPLKKTLLGKEKNNQNNII